MSPSTKSHINIWFSHPFQLKASCISINGQKKSRDVLLSSQEGIIIRLHANEIPLQSRYGSGVRVMRLGENDLSLILI